jgi:hypothetical protein
MIRLESPAHQSIAVLRAPLKTLPLVRLHVQT